MAEDFGTGGEADFEIVVRANWDQFDEDVRNKQSTFSSEGFGRGASGRLALPDYTRGAPAADQYARAIENQVRSFERFTSITRSGVERIYIPNNYGWMSGGGSIGGFPAVGGPGGGMAGGPGWETVRSGFGATGGAGGGGGGTWGPWGQWGTPPDSGGGGGGGGAGRGGLSAWRSFFIGYELTRFAGAAADAYRKQQIEEGLSLGDPGLLAMTDVHARERIASSLPFGIGQLATFFRDPTGAEELSVERPLAQAKMQDENTRIRQRLMVQSTRLFQAARLAGQTGLARSTQEVSDTAELERIALRQSSQDRADVVKREHDARLQEIADKYHDLDFWYGVFGTRGQAGELASENSAYQQRLANVRHQTVWDRASIDQREKGAVDLLKKQDDLARSGITASATGAAIYSQIGWDTSEQGLLGRRAQLGVTITERMIERSQLVAEQQQRENETRLNNPTRVAEIIKANRAQLGAFDVESTRRIATAVAEVVNAEKAIQAGISGTIISSNLKSQFRPFEAMQAEMEGQKWSDYYRANPDDRPGVLAAWNARIGAANNEVFRERAVFNARNLGMTQVLGSEIARNPLQATTQRIELEQKIANMQLPNDATPQMRQYMNEAFKQQKDLAIQQYHDQRALQTLDLKRQETVTGLLANAVGPGAEMIRLQARATDIGQTVEEKAQATLRADVTNLPNADRERRIGINQLRGLKAEYLEGFTASEGSLFRTNLSPAGATSGPEAVLNSIDAEIKKLNSKLGTLVATE